MSNNEKFNLEHFVDESYKFQNLVEPTVQLIKECKYDKAEKAFAKTALQLIREIASAELKPEEADSVFTLLDKYISSNFNPPRPFSDLFLNLLVEGMVIHHYGDGTGYGPDLEQMKRMANELLEK